MEMNCQLIMTRHDGTVRKLNPACLETCDFFVGEYASDGDYKKIVCKVLDKGYNMYTMNLVGERWVKTMGNGLNLTY